MAETDYQTPLGKLLNTLVEGLRETAKSLDAMNKTNAIQSGDIDRLQNQLLKLDARVRKIEAKENPF